MRRVGIGRKRAGKHCDDNDWGSYSGVKWRRRRTVEEGGESGLSGDWNESLGRIWKIGRENLEIYGCSK